MQFAKTKYIPFQAYAQSKLCNVLMCQEIPKRFSGVLAVSVHPGWTDTELMKHTGNSCLRCLLRCFLKKKDGAGDLLDLEAGAQTTLHCALSSPEDLENGAFYSQKGIYTDKAAQAGGWPMPLPNPNVTAQYPAKLWDESLRLCGLGPWIWNS